jgi:hypothetical protein
MNAVIGFSKFAEFSSSHTATEKRVSPYNQPYTVIHEEMFV